MLKLNIQLFSDGETTVVNTDALNEEQQIIQNEGNNLQENMNGAMNDVSSLESDQGLQSIAGSAIQRVFGWIAPKLGDFQTVVTDLGGFLSYVVTTYDSSDEAMRKEFESWGDSITGMVQNLKTGFTETASGYTTTEFITDLSSSTRTIANETVKMLSNTGKLWSSATGKSVVNSAQELGQAAVGAFKTLFNSSAGGGIFSKFVNQLVGTSM